MNPKDVDSGDVDLYIESRTVTNNGSVFMAQMGRVIK